MPVKLPLNYIQFKYLYQYIKDKIVKSNARTHGARLRPGQLSDLNNIKEELEANLNQEIKGKEVTLPDQFIKIFLEEFFIDVFTRDRELTKKESKEMARLYMYLYENEFPELFLLNYSRYRSG